MRGRLLNLPAIGRAAGCLLVAAAIIAAAPTLLVYIVAGRYFVRGLMAGAVKG